MTDDVCVLLPTYDEAATVADVVADFRERTASRLERGR